MLRIFEDVSIGFAHCESVALWGRLSFYAGFKGVGGALSPESRLGRALNKGRIE